LGVLPRAPDDEVVSRSDTHFLMPTRLLSGPFVRVTIANFFFFLNFASFFLLPLYVKSLGGSEAMVGAVMGTGGMAALVVLPFIGLALDRFGRRRFFVVGTIAMTAAALGYLLVDTIGPALFALRVVQGCSFAAAFTASTTLAAELAPSDRRAEALGIFGVSTLLTHALAPTIGEEIIRRAGFHALCVTAAAFSTLPLLLLPGVPPRRLPSVFAVRTLWRVGRLQWVVIGTMTLSGMGFGAVMTFIPTFVRGSDLGRVAFFYGAYTITAILTRFFGSGLSDSVGRRAIVLPTLLVLATSIFTLSLVHSVPVLVVAGILFGGAQGISYPTLHAFLVDLTAAEHLGRAQALFNGSFNLGVMSSAFLFGPVADHLGQRPMFAIAALMPLLACGLFYMYATEPPLPISLSDVAARSDPSGSGP
jgi:MFS family permease